MSEYPIWPNFFVIEGIDGSGKSSLIETLRALLDEKEKPHYVFTQEPTTSFLGSRLRYYISEQKNAHDHLDFLAQSFYADRVNHLFDPQKGVKQWIDENKIVVSDRYFPSTLAYQDMPFDSFEKFPWPEVLFYLGIDPEIAIARVLERAKRLKTKKTDFETRENLALYARRYEESLDYFEKKYKLPIHRLDGTQPTEDLARIVLKMIEKQKKEAQK